MQFARNRTIATITALFLVLTAAFSLVALPRANAQVQRTYISHCYVAASPLEVGVGQRMLVFAWMWTLPPNTIEETAQGGPAAGAWPSWHDLIVNVVQPSGSNVTIGPLNTDSAGGTYSSFTPTEVGIHTFQTYFPGETKNTTSFGTSYTTYYQPDWSEPYSVEILAEEQPTTASPAWPLPTGYWERPINYENQEWAMISGAWYGIPSGYGSRGLAV
jgi:hypothetical protein